MLVRIAAGYDKKYAAIGELQTPFETEDVLPNDSDTNEF